MKENLPMWGLTAVCLLLLVTSALPSSARVTLYPAPPGEPASQDYAVTVNGQPCFCYTSWRFDTESTTTISR